MLHLKSYKHVIFCNACKIILQLKCSEETIIYYYH
jgi:hypothetical protein